MVSASCQFVGEETGARERVWLNSRPGLLPRLSMVSFSTYRALSHRGEWKRTTFFLQEFLNT